MDLEIIILSKSERERQIPYNITYMWNLTKNDNNGLIYKTETNLQISQISKSNLCLPKENMGESDKLGDWD